MKETFTFKVTVETRDIELGMEKAVRDLPDGKPSGIRSLEPAIMARCRLRAVNVLLREAEFAVAKAFADLREEIKPQWTEDEMTEELAAPFQRF